MKVFISDVLVLLTIAIGIVLFVPLIFVGVLFAIPVLCLFGLAVLLNNKQFNKIKEHILIKKG